MMKNRKQRWNEAVARNGDGCWESGRKSGWSKKEYGCDATEKGGMVVVAVVGQEEGPGRATKLLFRARVLIVK
jgi:hypothetical protein